MKQSEKLDLILRYLYGKRFDGKYYDLAGILDECGEVVSFTEAFALGERLEADGMTRIIGTKSGMAVQLTTYGVDYIENDSYTYRGHSVITNNYNISVAGSTNTSIVQNSTNVTISQHAEKAGDLISRINDQLDKESIGAEKLAEIRECLEEIKEAISKNHKPKSAFRNLLTMTSELSSVGSMVIALGQLIGQH